MCQGKSMKNKNEIEQFISYFESEIVKISSIESSLYRKLLFTCMLDALSTARFPDNKTNNKIISFLLNCTKSSLLNRVSLIQLNLLLDCILSDQEKRSSLLLPFVRREMKKMKSGHIYRGDDIDPYFNQLDRKATSKEKKALKLTRYVNLFYAYRNEMVHGFKEPAYGMEISNDGSSPYYHGYQTKQWQLVFPSPFFKNLCTEALDGLKEYLYSKDINPYDQYKFLDSWFTTKKLKKLMIT
jgi:hypothetical protein